MAYSRRPRRPIYLGMNLPRLTKRQKRRLWALVVAAAVLAFLIQGSLFLRELSGAMALSDAIDFVTYTINDAINRRLSSGDYDYNYFVNLEKNNQGDIVAITADMARINTLSSELLQEVVTASDSGALSLKIPLGTLMGMSLLNGRGPDVPVDVIMLTSSRADFRNELVSAGINQTKHQIILELIVDIDVILPWKTLSTQVMTEVLLGETVIVGRVPDTFISYDGSRSYGTDSGDNGAS